MLYKYENPKDNNGVSYWVPIVVKDKQYLVGFLDGVAMTAEQLSSEFNSVLENMECEIEIDSFRFDYSAMGLNSERFTKLLPNGQRCDNFTEEDFIELAEKESEKFIDRVESDNPENENGILDSFLNLDCPTCGMFYSWDDAKTIPDEDFHCTICDRKLIQYIGYDDEEVETEWEE